VSRSGNARIDCRFQFYVIVILFPYHTLIAGVIELRLPCFQIIAVLVLTIASVAGAQSPIKIVHYNCTCHGEHWTDWLHHQAERFTAQHPHIELEIITDPSDYYDKLAILAATGEFPDVTEVIPAQSIPYLEQGLWLELTQVIEADPDFDLDRFIPTTLELFRWHGGLYGLPASAFTLITSYNADHFQAAGVVLPADTGDRWNWDGLLEAARRLTRDLSGDGVPDQYGVAVFRDIWRLSYWAENAGGTYFDRYIDPTEAHFTHPGVVQAAEFVKGWIDSGIAALDFSSSRDRLLSGSVSMIFDQGSTIIGYHRDNPQIALDFAPLPRGPVKGGTEVTANGFQISASSRYPEEVWRWVKHLTYNIDAARDHVTRTARVPALFELIPDFGFLIGTSAPHANAWVEEAANPESRIRPLVREGVQIGRLFATTMTAILEGRMPAREAFSELDRQVNAILREAHGRR